MKMVLMFIVLVIASWASDEQKLQLGEKLYKEICVSCHGPKGEGNDEIQLVVKSRKLNRSILNEEQSYYIIKEGARHWGAHSDIMPSFKYVYDEHELRALANYISKIFNPNLEQRIQKLCSTCDKVPDDKISKMLKRGKKIYNRNCSWCHGIDGKGDGSATRNPEKSIYPYDLTKTLLTKKQMFLYMREGGQHWGTHKEDMPSWKKKYDDFTLRSIAKYIDEVLREK